jgi:hypothetical protein
MLWEVHVFAWLPYAKIDNPLWNHPDRDRFGPAAAGPFFEGDRHVIPPRWPGDFRLRTCRAWHAVEVAVPDWGSSGPVRSSGVVANEFHVLAEDGTSRVHSEPGAVTRSVTRVGFNPRENCYDVALEGAVTVPFLLEATQIWKQFQDDIPVQPPEEHSQPASVPAIAWDLQLHIRQGMPPTPIRRASQFDESHRFFGSVRSLGGEGDNLVYGTCTVCLFPSYAVYVSLRCGRESHSAPVLFVNGFGHSTNRTAVKEQCALRAMTW